VQTLNLISGYRRQINFGKNVWLLLCLFSLASKVSIAQHDMNNMPMDSDTMKMDNSSMQMTSFFSPNLPMNRDGSGTSWQPDVSPLWMYMKMKGNTSLMVHGSLFLRYTAQDITNESDRGGTHLDAPNMFMLMLMQKLNDKNLISILTMFSLDPLTVGSAGYPLLFQTGESYKGVPLVDKQHPHDLFAELALNYTHSFTKDIDINTYFGYPGEPALGPVVFMHRLSAMNNPDAPLGHHWQDASHITFGVGTIGLRYKNMKAEGSIFTGREPDENRYNFDKPTFDSYSYRITVNPNKNFSLQFSQGFIKSPEELFPDENVTRTTASVIHTKLFEQGNFISSSFVWGMNHSSDGKNLNSVLLESNLQVKPIIIYARYEFVQKDAQELQLLQFTDNPTFFINALTLGLNKILFKHKAGNISIGAQGTINIPDKDLTGIYGNYPLAGQVYIKFFPSSGSVTKNHMQE
jgi:hypothetical protein